MDRRSILFDATRCVGCHSCVLACREANGHAISEPHDRLHANAFLAVERRNGRHIRKACMHCEDPACVSVCPVGALRKNEDGAVTYDTARCMGCRYCMVACPFSVPRYEWNEVNPLMKKCELCTARRAAGGTCACVAACPKGALAFGTREEMIAEATRRIEGGGYTERIYGLKEGGGTTVLMISDVPFSQLGLPDGLPDEAMPNLTWEVIHRLPGVVSFMGAGMAGLWWIIRRRDELAGREDA